MKSFYNLLFELSDVIRMLIIFMIEASNKYSNKLWKQLSAIQLERCILILISILISIIGSAAEPASYTLGQGERSISFSAKNGSILFVGKSTILKSAKTGLWQARFQDGSTVNAADFSSDSPERLFENIPMGSANNEFRFRYRSADIVVVITVSINDNTYDFVAQITPQKKVLLDFALPARLRFNADGIERFIFPMDGNFSVGAAFEKAFFEEQPLNHPIAWRPGPVVGPKGYIALYGGPLNQRPDHDPAVALRTTDDGHKWFSDALSKRIDNKKAVVNRPPTPTQADIVLVDSENGPYLSAHNLGKGRLWRIGGKVEEGEKQIVLEIITALAERLANGTASQSVEKHGQDTHNIIGLIALERGPESGGWANVKVAEWSAQLKRIAAAYKTVEFLELKTLSDIEQALQSDKYALILNPYGEWTPVLPGKNMAATVESIGRYVHSGGNWIEVGGYPFFAELHPVRFLNYSVSYPPAFTDFMYLEGKNSSVAIYGIQPQKWKPWEGAKNKDAIFVPGRLGCGADEKGGYCERSFATYVKAGMVWKTPIVRLVISNSRASTSGLIDEIDAYCKLNEIKRRLGDKMSADVLNKLKKSVLVYYAGNAKEKTEHLNLLPVPTLIHFADYLHGGFDKQYPDHLPPNPSFGTGEDLRAFFDNAHQIGHLISPYTNPTWWCDHPKGPTFEREGDAPLLKGLDGKPVYERYGINDGWTVCHWHPAVQSANRKTVGQFTTDYPVDILFQDQCGARGWRYDLNPASPTPYAYSDGLISMVAEDCKRVPLGTEAGWDRVVNYESLLCGMTFKILSTEFERAPSYMRLMKSDYPPNTWRFYPLAEQIAHDKTAMLHHDLGQFVFNRGTLSFTLALGFSLSYSVPAKGLIQDAQREWLRWLDRAQKAVCSRYIAEPIRSFNHKRFADAPFDDDGIIEATYGNVHIVANLGPTARVVDGRNIAPFGFYASAPGMSAGNLKNTRDLGDDGISFVVESQAEKSDIWVYASSEQDVAVVLPTKINSIDKAEGDIAPNKYSLNGDTFAFTLPPRSGAKRITPPAELANKAPRDWQGVKPSIGILDFSPQGKSGSLVIQPSWTSITARQWYYAFAQSRLAKEYGVPVRRITNVDDLVSALKSGGTNWLAIINPYGEHFPETAPGKWREMIELIRQYVNNGGSWWETAGYSLYGAYFVKDGATVREDVGPAGMIMLGIPVGGGEVNQPPELLQVPAEGRIWLGEELAAKIEKLTSVVNRGLPRRQDDPGHIALVSRSASSPKDDFIGGYRLNGWGWFWRIGGFNPNPEVALPVAIAAMEFIYTNPPLLVKSGGAKYLWHITLQTKP